MTFAVLESGDLPGSKCPSVESRIKMTQEWSCEEFNAFVRIESAFCISAFATKTMQVLVFAFLLAILIAQRCQGNASIGKLPMLICAATIINGIFCIVRTYSLFPVWGMTENYKVFAISYNIDDCFFFLAIWLFALKYYETAFDIQRMMLLKDESTETTRRKTQ